MAHTAKWKRAMKPQYKQTGKENKIGPYFYGWGYEDCSTHYWRTFRYIRSRTDKYKNKDRTTIRKWSY